MFRISRPAEPLSVNFRPIRFPGGQPIPPPVAHDASSPTNTDRPPTSRGATERVSMKTGRYRHYKGQSYRFWGSPDTARPTSNWSCTAKIMVIGAVGASPDHVSGDGGRRRTDRAAISIPRPAEQGGSLARQRAVKCRNCLGTQAFCPDRRRQGNIQLKTPPIGTSHARVDGPDPAASGRRFGRIFPLCDFRLNLHRCLIASEHAARTAGVDEIGVAHRYASRFGVVSGEAGIENGTTARSRQPKAPRHVDPWRMRLGSLA